MLFVSISRVLLCVLCCVFRWHSSPVAAGYPGGPGWTDAPALGEGGIYGVCWRPHIVGAPMGPYPSTATVEGENALLLI